MRERCAVWSLKCQLLWRVGLKGSVNWIQARSFMYNYRNICCEKHFISFFVIGYFWAVKHGQGNKPIDLNWTKNYWFQLIEFNLRPKSTRMSRGFQNILLETVIVLYLNIACYVMLHCTGMWANESVFLQRHDSPVSILLFQKWHGFGICNSFYFP